MAGQIREDATYNDGTPHACTTGTNPMSMTRELQGSQAAGPPPAGSYSGSDNTGAGYRFYVSPDGTQIQDVAVTNSDRLNCAPGTSFNDSSFNISNIAIASDGSFTATATQTGVESGFPATFTYTFSGHFHGSELIRC